MNDSRPGKYFCCSINLPCFAFTYYVIEYVTIFISTHNREQHGQSSMLGKEIQLPTPVFEQLHPTDVVICCELRLFNTIHYQYIYSIQFVRKVAVQLDLWGAAISALYCDLPRTLIYFKTAITAFIKKKSHKQICRKCLRIKLDGFRPL
jgi:hypothetical protein